MTEGLWPRKPGQYKNLHYERTGYTMATPTALVGVKLTLENGKVVTLHEGDIVTNLMYKENALTTAVVTGAVRVIHATTTKVTTPNNCPPVPYAHRLLSVGSLVIDTSLVFDASLVRVDISKIVDIGEVSEDGGAIAVGPGPQYKALNEVIAEAPEGALISLKAGTYMEPLTITKGIHIVADGDVVMTAPVTVAAAVARAASAGDATGAGRDVYIEGVKFSGEACVKVNANVDSLTLYRCTFDGIDYAAKTMPISIANTVTEPMVLDINECVFGDLGDKSYNLIDVYAPLATGSQISRNTFKEGCCTHNQISLYGLDTNACVEISENVVELSKNLLRIGCVGAPAGRIELLENTILKTDTDTDWAGICVIQPYGNKTTTMAGLHVVVNSTNNKTGVDQLVYMYNGANDMKFTDDNKPTVEIDGKNVTAEIAVRS